jgi:CRISPR-associated Csx2 family protein
MTRVFLSFLGLGSLRKDGTRGYTPAVYELEGHRSQKTEFVQVAEHEILSSAFGRNPFDRTIIVVTQKSFETNFARLEECLKIVGANEISPVIISEDMSREGQWGWFEQILARIEHGDCLTVDLTHGYRAIPIIFSTAINFLQKARGVTLDAIYYGAFDQDPNLVPLVDMKEFHLINEWAEAVSRLIEDADARKMARVAALTPGFQVGELNDDKILRAFEQLTDTLRNVDIHNVASKADAAIGLVKEKERDASLTGKMLLGLVLDKFASLAAEEPSSGRYDRAYFRKQIEIIRLLLHHRLYMQAYTVMREFIGSIGLIGIDKVKVSSAKGRRIRRRFADVFVNMFQYAESKWDFSGDRQYYKDSLLPYYQWLREMGIEPILRSFVKELVDYRNGFDHAWTLKSGAKEDIENKGVGFLNSLEDVVGRLIDRRIL